MEKVISLREERIAYLERMLYGDRKDRKKDAYEGPGLFEYQFRQAVDERETKLTRAAHEIEQEAKRRREVSKQSGASRRPAKYQSVRYSE